MAICFNPGFFREKQIAARTAEQLLAENSSAEKVSRVLEISTEGVSKLLNTFGILQTGNSAHIGAIKGNHQLLAASLSGLNTLSDQLGAQNNVVEEKDKDKVVSANNKV